MDNDSYKIKLEKLIEAKSEIDLHILNKTSSHMKRYSTSNFGF